jgi:hypothetical protein
LVAQRGVFFLAGRVEDLEHAGLAVDDYLFAVGVFDCWVVSGDNALVGWRASNGERWTHVSTKCCRHSCIVRAVCNHELEKCGGQWSSQLTLPTPPSPSTTSLYRIIFPDML